LPGDMVGIEHAVIGRSSLQLTAATTVGYRLLAVVALRALMADRQAAAHMLAVAAEARWREYRHAIAITRLDARERLSAFSLDIYDRLRRRNMISRPIFNLALTQEQVADHLGLTTVHISRTLRRLREERIVLVDRQVVIITDLAAMRRIVDGLPSLEAPAVTQPTLEAGA